MFHKELSKEFGNETVGRFSNITANDTLYLNGTDILVCLAKRGHGKVTESIILMGDDEIKNLLQNILCAFFEEQIIPEIELTIDQMEDDIDKVNNYA